MKDRYSSDEEMPYDVPTLKRYLQAELEPSIMAEIAEAENTSEAVALQLKGLRQLLNLMGEDKTDSFLHKNWEKHLSTIKTHGKNASPPGIHKMRYMLALAASLGLLIGLAIYFMWKPTSDISSASLLAQEMERPVELVGGMAFRGNDKSLFPWEQAYQKGNYQTVRSLLSTRDSLGEGEYFYRALSAMYTQKFDSALTDFQEVITLDNANGFLQKAEWLSVLLLFEEGHRSRGKVLLQHIKGTKDHAYYSPAIQLWDSLDSQ